MKISLGRYDATLGMASIESDLGGGRMFHMELDLRQPSQRYIFECHTYTGWYEAETVAIIRANLRAGDVFFDVGAHVGYFSRLALDLGALVVAYEPDAESIKYLTQNIPIVCVSQCAVGAAKGKRLIYRNADNDGGHAFWDVGIHPHNVRSLHSGCALPVDVMPLDEFEDACPHVIEIDTEGAEVEVLKGAQTILAQPQLRCVVCELNHFGLAQMGSNEAEMRAIMARHGFSAPYVDAVKDTANLFFTRA